MLHRKRGRRISAFAQGIRIPMKQQKAAAANVTGTKYVALEVRRRWSLSGSFREGFLEEKAIKLRLEGWVGCKKAKKQESL